MSDQNYQSSVGSEVYSRDGANVGSVAGIVDNAGQGTFLNVQHNGLFGIGAESYLVPTDAILSVEDGKVTVNKSAEAMVGIPAHDGHEPTGEGYFSSIYAWWWHDDEN